MLSNAAIALATGRWGESSDYEIRLVEPGEALVVTCRAASGIRVRTISASGEVNEEPQLIEAIDTEVPAITWLALRATSTTLVEVVQPNRTFRFLLVADADCTDKEAARRESGAAHDRFVLLHRVMVLTGMRTDKALKLIGKLDRPQCLTTVQYAIQLVQDMPDLDAALTRTDKLTANVDNLTQLRELLGPKLSSVAELGRDRRFRVLRGIKITVNMLRGVPRNGQEYSS